MYVMERTQIDYLFGEIMKRRRLELGLSQDDVADRMPGWEASRISKVETGHTFRRMPDADTFNAWVKALDLDPVRVLSEMGYLDGPVYDRQRTPELVFNSIADELRSSDTISHELKDLILDVVKHVQRIHQKQARR